MLCVLFRSTAESTVADSLSGVIHRNPVFHKDSLHKSGSRGDYDGLSFFSVVRNLCLDMTFIIREKIITVDDAYGVVQLQAVLRNRPQSINSTAVRTVKGRQGKRL